MFFEGVCLGYWYKQESPDVPELVTNSAGQVDFEEHLLLYLQFLDHAQKYLPALSQGKREHNEGAVGVFLHSLWDDVGLRLPRGPVQPDYDGDNDDLSLSGRFLFNQVTNRWTRSNRTNLRASTHIESYKEALLLELNADEDASVQALYDEIFLNTGKARPATATDLRVSDDWDSRDLSWKDDGDWRGWFRRAGGADARSKSWSNFDDGSSYVFQVRARNDVGYGSTAQISASALGPGGSREAGPVTLTVYNVAGQVVAELARGEVLEAGLHAREWFGTDEADRPVASGLYLYRLVAGDQVRVGKLALIR